MDKILADQPLKVPTMLVHSLWDQEDIYGAIAVYKALEPKDPATTWCSWCSAPGTTARRSRTAARLGALRFESNTALWFRQRVLRPFLDHYLKDDAPKSNVAPVTAYETGTNAWRRLDAWPAGLRPAAARSSRRRSTCSPDSQARLHRAHERRRGVRRVRLRSRQAGTVPRPADPARGLRRPFTWDDWLVDDQREAVGPAGRAGVHLRRAHGASQDQRAAGGQPGRLDQRHGRRLGGEADRRLPRRGGRPAGDGRLSAHGLGRHLPRAIPRRAWRRRSRSRRTSR